MLDRRNAPSSLRAQPLSRRLIGLLLGSALLAGPSLLSANDEIGGEESVTIPARESRAPRLHAELRPAERSLLEREESTSPLGRLGRLPELIAPPPSPSNPGLGLFRLDAPDSPAIPGADLSSEARGRFGRVAGRSHLDAAPLAIRSLAEEHLQLLSTLSPGEAPGGDPHGDLLAPLVHAPDPEWTAVTALAERWFHRELRRELRRQERENFQQDPTRDYESYLERRSLIGQIGRGGRLDDLVIEERTTELRNESLDSLVEDPETRLPLLRWGPLILDDRGRVSVDVADLGVSGPEDFSFGPSAEAPRRGDYFESLIYPEERVRARTSLRLRPDLGRVGRDWGDAAGKLSGSVEFDWREPVLGRRACTAELGGSINADGEYGLFLNFVIYGN